MKPEEKKEGKKGKEEEQIAKYRELLRSVQEKDKKEKDKDMEMEITWVPGRFSPACGVHHGNRWGMGGFMCDGADVRLIFIRVKGERGETGEEEDGGERQNDSMGGVSGEEKGEEESEEERKGQEGFL